MAKLLYEHDGDQFGHWTGEINTFSGDDYDENYIWGDVTGTLYGYTKGGNDTLIGGNTAYNQLSGDAYAIQDNAKGGNDTLIAGDYSINEVSGDAYWRLSGNAKGGNDTLIGGDYSINDLVGDSWWYMNYGSLDPGGASGSAKGGNDTLIGGSDSENYLRGDTFAMYNEGRGGNDTLVGGDGSFNLMEGDAQALYENSKGGNDTLIAGDEHSFNLMYGDAFKLDHAQGGNDILVSGPGTDFMWGDSDWKFNNPQGGKDTFVFNPDNGEDMIFDFEQGKDVIDLHALDLSDVLDSNSNGILDDGDDYVSIIGSDTVIDLGAAAGQTGTNLVTIVGQTELQDLDFIFGPPQT